MGECYVSRPFINRIDVSTDIVLHYWEELISRMAKSQKQSEEETYQRVAGYRFDVDDEIGQNSGGCVFPPRVEFFYEHLEVGFVFIHVVFIRVLVDQAQDLVVEREKLFELAVDHKSVPALEAEYI